MRNGCLVGSLVASILVTAAVQAHAQAGWNGRPELLSSNGSGETKIGMDALGNAVAVWTGHDPVGPPGMVAGHYAVATRQWRSVLVSPALRPMAWDLAVDGLGNAIAIRRHLGLGADDFAVYHYDHATDKWTLRSTPIPVVAGTAPLVAMASSGSATVCWNHTNSSIHCSRYTPSTGAWSAGTQVGFSTTLGDVAMDAAGVAHVVWTVGSNVRTSQYDPNTAAWSAPHDLAVGLAVSPAPDPRIAVNEAGVAVATWTRGSVLEASRYTPGIGWSPAVALSVDGTANASARSAVNPAGDITVAWAHEASPARTIQVARYIAGAWTTPDDVSGPDASGTGPIAIAADASGNAHLLWRQLVGSQSHLVATKYAASTGQWAEPADLSGLSGSIFEPDLDVAVDGAGNAIAIWAQDGLVRSLRWDPTPAPPTISGVSPVAGALSVSFVLPSTSEPALGISGLEYSLDGGATWVTSPSMVSPLTIAGLTDGVTYDVRLRGINSAGAGRATDPLLVKSGTDSTLHDLRVVARSGNTLTFAWSGPDAGVLPATYVLAGGILPGETLGTVAVAGTHTNVTLTMPTGVFYIRVAALLPLGAGLTSNEIRVAVGTAEPPAAPSNLLGTVNGSDLQLSWTNAYNGGIPTGVTLQVSGAVTASIPLPVGETLAFSGVPPGTYTLALTASNGAGTSAPSAPVTLTFPAACAGPPAAPTNMSAGVSAGIVTLAWDPPAAGPAISSYIINVAGAFSGALPVTSRVLTAPAPAGSYIVSVAAANACGTGVATAPISVVVP